LKNIIFNANDLCEITRFAIFKDADGVISSQLRSDLGDNTRGVQKVGFPSLPFCPSTT